MTPPHLQMCPLLITCGIILLLMASLLLCLVPDDAERAGVGLFGIAHCLII